MLAASLRSRSLHLSSSLLNHSWKPVLSGSSHSFSVESNGGRSLLDLNEIEKVLTDVKADDVKVIPAQKHAEWADYMVIATGRSTWHVKNIAQALIYKAKQKQKGARRMTLPSVEGQEGGKWIVIDSGLSPLYDVSYVGWYRKSSLICWYFNGRINTGLLFY